MNVTFDLILYIYVLLFSFLFLFLCIYVARYANERVKQLVEEEVRTEEQTPCAGHTVAPSLLTNAVVFYCTRSVSEGNSLIGCLGFA